MKQRQGKYDGSLGRKRSNTHTLYTTSGHLISSDSQQQKTMMINNDYLIHILH